MLITATDLGPSTIVRAINFIRHPITGATNFYKLVCDPEGHQTKAQKAAMDKNIQMFLENPQIKNIIVPSLERHSRVVEATSKSMHYIEIEELQKQFSATTDPRVFDSIIREWTNDWKNHLVNNTSYQPPKAEEVLPTFPYSEVLDKKKPSRK